MRMAIWTILIACGAAAADTELSIQRQEFTVRFLPDRSAVDVVVQWDLRNDGALAAPGVTAYLADVGTVTEVAAPGRGLTWTRSPSLIPFFSSVQVRFARPLAPGDACAVRFAYTLRYEVAPTGLAAMSMSLGADHAYLFEAWYPTITPFIDTDTFIRRGQKPPFRLSASVPRGFTGITAGTLTRTETDGAQDIFVYESADPPPFLIPFVAARFTRHDRDGLPVPVTLFLRDLHPDTALDEFCAFLARCAAAQAAFLNRPAPGRLAVALMETGGLARGFPDMIIVPPSFRHRWRDPFVASTIAHELAHTYFGNMVTAYGPGGNEFLSEGLATFMGIKTAGTVLGPDSERLLFQAQRREFFAGEARDVAIVQIRPMQNVLSGEVYTKGSLVLNELGRWLGEDTLRRILQAYLAMHAGQFVTLEAFRAVARTHCAPELRTPLDAFLHQVLETTALPWVMLETHHCAPDPGGGFRSEIVLRNRGDGHAHAPVSCVDSGGKELLSRLCDIPAGAVARVTVHTSVPVARVIIDPDGTYFHGVRRASLLAHARDLRAKGDLDAAGEQYRKLCALLPGDGELWYGLGRVEQARGRLQEAAAAYRRAADTAGTEWLPTWAWIREAEIARKRGALTEARALLQRVRDEGNDTFDAQAHARDLLLELGG